MIVKARKPISAEPPARPSRPSVTLTALLVAQIIVPAQRTQTYHGTCQLGIAARVNQIVSLMPVAPTSQAAMPKLSASVIQLLRFQKMPRLWLFLTLM